VLARRLLAAMVLIACFWLPVASSLAADGTCHDDCDPTCSDCTLCAGVAALAPAPAPSLLGTGLAGAVCAARAPPVPPAPPRAIGHVPLASR